MEGKVRWFNRIKGYGFVEGDDGEDYFVHKSSLAEGTFIRDNDRVSFEPAESEKGKQAQNVTLLQKGSEISEEDTEESKEDAEETKEDTEESKEDAEETKEDTEESKD